MKPINKLREENIVFTEHNHKYTLKSNPNLKLTSVTQLISKFFHKFNANQIIRKIKNSRSYGPGHKYWDWSNDQIKECWENNRDFAAMKGTELHKLIEEYLNNIKTDKIKLKVFLDWYKSWTKLGWECVATEMIVYDERYKIAGSIDSIWKNSKGEHVIVDWKRSGKDIVPDIYYDMGLYPMTHIPDNSYYKYSLQQNIYAYLLNKNYGITVKNVYLVQFPPGDLPYVQIKCPIMQEDVITMLNHKYLKIVI